MSEASASPSRPPRRERPLQVAREAAAPPPPPPATPPSAADTRRARFRTAVEGLSRRAQAGDLTRMVLLPAAIALIAGFNFLIWGWWGAAHTFRQIEQIPYLISGGLVGLALVFLGGLLLASALWITLLQRFLREADDRTARRIADLESRLLPPDPPA